MRVALPILFLAALWDTLITAYGTWVFLVARTPAVPLTSALLAATSMLVGAITFIFMYFTFNIFGQPQARDGTIALKVLWWIALLYKFFTSLNAYKSLIAGSMSNQAYMALVPMTLLVGSSPILTSWILFEVRKQAKCEDAGDSDAAVARHGVSDGQHPARSERDAE
jgi:hypothetical protein